MDRQLVSTHLLHIMLLRTILASKLQKAMQTEIFFKVLDNHQKGKNIIKTQDRCIIKDR